MNVKNLFSKGLWVSHDSQSRATNNRLNNRIMKQLNFPKSNLGYLTIAKVWKP